MYHTLFGATSATPAAHKNTHTNTNTHTLTHTHTHTHTHSHTRTHTRTHTRARAHTHTQTHTHTHTHTQHTPPAVRQPSLPVTRWEHLGRIQHLERLRVTHRALLFWLARASSLYQDAGIHLEGQVCQEGSVRRWK
jgi:hypothetical protein